MPAYVLKCRTCATYQAFLLHDQELIELEKKPIVRHCASAAKTHLGFQWEPNGGAVTSAEMG
jgi:hypothetical protein